MRWVAVLIVWSLVAVCGCGEKPVAKSVEPSAKELQEKSFQRAVKDFLSSAKITADGMKTITVESLFHKYANDFQREIDLMPDIRFNDALADQLSTCKTIVFYFDNIAKYSDIIRKSGGHVRNGLTLDDKHVHPTLKEGCEESIKSIRESHEQILQLLEKLKSSL